MKRTNKTYTKLKIIHRSTFLALSISVLLCGGGIAVAEPVASAAEPAAKSQPQTDKKEPAPGNPSATILHYTEAAPGHVWDTIPFWWHGEFHLFFLNQAKWSHARTSDFVNWEKLPDAILAGGMDAACWTGSVIEKDGTFYLFYTGKNGKNHQDPKADQKVKLATSKDLIHFEKRPDFTLYADGKFYWNKTINGPLDKSLPIEAQFDESFRDPEVSWNPEHKEYWMLLHSRDAKTQYHNFGLYRSDDLLNWTPRPALTTSMSVHQRNIDCPVLFPLAGKWYLIFSGGRYSIADKSDGPYSAHRSYDFNNYVDKVRFDGQGRALTVGTARSATGNPDGSRSTMVREFYAGSDGRLLQRPLPEVIAAFPKTTQSLSTLSGCPATGHVDCNGKNIRFVREEQDARITISDAPQDFLADFTVELAADSTFRLNFRGDARTVGYTLEISTADNKLWVGTASKNTESSKEFAERGINVPANHPLKVKLFMVGDLIECFVEDVCALTINAYDLKGSKMTIETVKGSARLDAFELKERVSK